MQVGVVSVGGGCDIGGCDDEGGISGGGISATASGYSIVGGVGAIVLWWW